MSASAIGLVVTNAKVLTMDPSVPEAEAVAVAGERIAAVGSDSEIRRLASRSAKVIDCQGLTLLPGFNDAHIHLPGLARRLQDLDCSPDRAASIAALQALVREQAASQPAGSWVRGHGYDDLGLAERRHPDRHDLDAAAPHHPVWLEHRSGHASVLSSRALALAGIDRETPDPPGGVIERDPSTGEPTGVLFEMHSFLRRRLGILRAPAEFEAGMRVAERLLTSYGITSVQDAGADNGIDRWQTFQRLQLEGILPGRITMFAGIGRLDELLSAGLSFGSGNHRLRLGHAKIMLTLTSGALDPSPGELGEMISDAHGRGFPVAVHCIEEEAIEAAASALQAHTWGGVRDRIEHCAEGTPELLRAVQESGAAVVPQPGFVYHNGPGYRANVEPRLLPHLYPAGSLVRCGVPTAFGSDAPVIDPNPWPAFYSAVTRRTADRLPLSPEGDDCQAVSRADALRMYTTAGAEAEGTQRDKGSITPGKLADLVLVDADPLSIDPAELAAVRTVLTVVGGRVVWEK